MIVTGAGSGIGRCLAHELAALCADVVLVGRDPVKLAGVAEEIAADGGSAVPLPCDIRDEAMVAATVDAVLAQFGRVDGLVNNAGGQYRAALHDISTKGFDAVLRTNLTGGFIFMRAVYDCWMRDHGGAIVNMIADMWNGFPEFAHSGAARAGMWSLTQSAACEWAATGVRVNAVAPGGIASSGLDTYPPEMQAKLGKHVERVPMGRFGTEAEVSAAIVFLLSPAAAYITGTCLRIDGGAPNARQTWTAEPAGRCRPFDGFHRSTKPEALRQFETSSGDGQAMGTI
jgi:citronellol/citronellal dehydrogenase